jgi:hypothetical protein
MSSAQSDLFHFEMHMLILVPTLTPRAAKKRFVFHQFVLPSRISHLIAPFSRTHPTVPPNLRPCISDLCAFVHKLNPTLPTLFHPPSATENGLIAGFFHRPAQTATAIKLRPQRLPSTLGAYTDLPTHNLSERLEHAGLIAMRPAADE